MDQLSFASLDFAAKKKLTRREVFLAEMRTKGLTAALQHRDEPFGDYRTQASGEGR